MLSEEEEEIRMEGFDTREIYVFLSFLKDNWPDNIVSLFKVFLRYEIGS